MTICFRVEVSAGRVEIASNVSTRIVDKSATLTEPASGLERAKEMARKSDFASMHWKMIVQAPLLAGFAVSAADPSGFLAIVQEALATTRSLEAVKANESDNDLIGAVVEDLQCSGGRADAREGVRTVVAGAGLAEIKARALEALKETAELLDAQAPEEAAAFKIWLGQIAQTIAESASREEFVGFSGIQLSETEKATIKEISRALGL